MSRGLALLVLLVGVLVARDAGAEMLVQDGDTFSIDLSEARICFSEPRSLRTQADCEGLGPDLNLPLVSANPNARPLAAGVVRVPGNTISSRMLGVINGIVLPAKNPSFHATEIDRYGRELVKTLALRVAPHARLLEPVERIHVSTKGVQILRVSVGVDGLSADDTESVGRYELVVIYARDATYVFSFAGPASSGVALNRAADAAASTVNLAPKRRPSTDWNVDLLNSLLPFSVPVVVFGIVMVLRRRSASRDTEWPSQRQRT
jgi:hypothetical protein